MPPLLSCLVRAVKSQQFLPGGLLGFTALSFCPVWLRTPAVGPQRRACPELVHRNSACSWVLVAEGVGDTRHDLSYLLGFCMCLYEQAQSEVTGKPSRLTSLFEGNLCTTHAAFPGESGRSHVCFHIFVCAWKAAGLPGSVLSPRLRAWCCSTAALTSRAAREMRCVRAVMVSVLTSVSPAQVTEGDCFDPFK